ncbi:serine protease do-like HtrA [Limosilactobacillus coleohominis 101-4-CHN]|uniref:Serine protease do-like HtrA n=1 Tax=Limosilactobacillus coleohominis 101-4-CHN TaxID=575594 RepID=C7XXI2_9LACO|nr:trypsin-like peptidase domain-containing protein [Limosilactobacillus coleohominis]EEU29733.1 serine protease do-like HtrA [Limosilactobacillus coleohominis 101-4-CHN]
MQQKNNKFWIKVAVVGLIAGLIGGGLSLGIGNVVSGIRDRIAMRTPAGSNKAGGTSVAKNKANLNNESTKAYKSVKDSVVSVINLQNRQSSSSIYSLFGQSSGQSSSGKLQTVSEGSGVIYKKSGGSAYIVTNNHVVSGSNALKVIMSNGKEVSAKIVGTDSTTDLAVLRISAANVKTVASFGNSNDIEAGQDVLAIGSPMGSEYANTVTKGIISAKNRTIRAKSGAAATSVIQTDAAINSGNSGGPLINMAGQVIGINSMKLASDTNGSNVEGMGFSIPSNEVVRIINQLVKNGKITRPSLGVGLIDLSSVSQDQQSSVLKLPSSVTKGAVVMTITDGGAAKNAGIKKYDVITKIGNKSVTDVSSLRTALYKYKVGQSAKITYYRNGKAHTVTVKLTENDSSANSSSDSESSQQESDQDQQSQDNDDAGF